MKKGFTGIVAGLILATVSGVSFAENDPLVGKWKTIDDRTSYSRADVEIRKKPDGTYEGIIVETRNIPGAEKMNICHQCPGQLKTNRLSACHLSGALSRIQKTRYSLCKAVYSTRLAAKSIKARHA